jgi:hypothetical protein
VGTLDVLEGESACRRLFRVAAHDEFRHRTGRRRSRGDHRRIVGAGDDAATGTLAFKDVDLLDVHTVSAVAQGAGRGARLVPSVTGPNVEAPT